MKIQNINISKLKPYANNPRKNAEAVQYVANSIKEFGFKQPIVIDKNFEIVAGHTRYYACKQLGLTDIPCVIADDLTPEQIKAYRIADNSTGEAATWDFDLLNFEIDGLDFDFKDFGLDLDFLNEQQETEACEAEITEDEVQDVDEESEPTVKMGQVWQLGKHRLMCGDSTKESDVYKLMNGIKADMCITSPPYNSGDTTNIYNKDSYQKLYKNISDNKTKKEYFDFCILILENIYKITKEKCAVIWNTSYCSNARDDYGKIIFSEKNKFKVYDTIIWKKSNAFPPRGQICQRICEFVFFMCKDEIKTNQKTINDIRKNIWEINNSNVQTKEHKACFPVQLVANAINWYSESNKDVVFEPFGGSGTTIVACEQLNRTCYTMELDPMYCDVIIKRYETLTGDRARLLSE